MQDVLVRVATVCFPLVYGFAAGSVEALLTALAAGVASARSHATSDVLYTAAGTAALSKVVFHLL